MQGFYNFEAHQVVQCMYKPHNLAIDQQTNPNMYPSQNFYSNQRDSSGQDQLLQVTIVLQVMMTLECITNAFCLIGLFKPLFLLYRNL